MAIRKNIRGITIELDAKTTGLQEALNNVEGRISSINKELRDLNNLLKFEPKSTELLGQKQEVLREQIAATTEKLKKLKDAEAEVERQFAEGKINAEQYRDFKKEIEQTESKLKSYKGELKEFENVFTRVGNSLATASEKFGKAGQAMQDVGKNLTRHVTVPIAAVGTVAFKAAMDFESGMAGVRKTTDLTADELAKMGQSLRDMAQEIPVGVVELTKLAETAGQLGIKKENIVDFTRTVADLSVATNIVGQEGATNMARFANIMQMSQKDFDRMGSSIVELGNNTATTEKEILDMSMRLAGASYQAKMSEADVLGIAAALSALGLEAQAGGSAFSRVINRIQLAVDTGSEDLEEFATVAGMTSEQFARAWGKDAAEALSIFILGLADTQKHGKTTNELLDDLGITEIRLGDALRRTSGANELFTSTLAMSNRAWDENNALQTEAAIRYETTESKLAIAKNQMNDAAIELGQKLIPVVTDVVGKVTDLVTSFTNLSPEMQDFIIKVAGISAISGPVINILGKISSGISKITDIASKASLAIGDKGFIGGLASIGGPAVIAAGAIAGVVAIITSLATHSKTTEGRINSLAKETEKASKEFKRTTDGIKDQGAQAKTLADRLYALEGKTKRTAAEQAEMESIVGQLNSLFPSLNLEIGKQTGLLNKSKQAVNDYIDAWMKQAKMQAYSDEITEAYKRRIEAVELLRKAEEETAKELERLATDQSSAVENMSSVYKLNEDRVRNTIKAIDEEIGRYRSAVKGMDKDTSTAADGLKDSYKKMSDYVATSTDKQEKSVSKYGEKFVESADKVKSKIDELNSANQRMGGIVEESHRKMTGSVIDSTAKQGEALDEISDKYEEEANKFEKYLKRVEEGTESHLRSMSGFSKDKLDLAKVTAEEYIKHLNIETEAFKNYHGNLNEIAERVGPDVAEHLKSLGPEAAPLIAQFVKMSDEELAGLAVAVREQTAAAKEEARKGAVGFADAGKQAALDYLRGVIEGLKNKTLRGNIKKEAGDVGTQITKSTKYTLMSKSPSKVGIDIGENYVESIGMGIRNAMKHAGQAAQDMTQSIIDQTTLEPPRLLSSAQVDGRSAIASLDKSSSQHITSGDIVIQEMIVRNDNDIRLIARELHNLQQGQLRGRGVA